MVERFFEYLQKLISVINKAFVFVASLMMAGLVVIVCIDLVLRYFFNAPLLWGTEVTEIFLLYITFLGTAWVFKEDGHVVVDVFTGQAKGRRRKALMVIGYLLIAVVSAVLIYYGFYATYDHHRRGVFNPTILETPIALIIMIIPIGSIPLFLEVLVKGWKLMKQS
ncbi:MAG: TRAP transporter small permease subunit [Thermodesulfobacteriota bacterium]|nr:TRAP transporter small permease subunit [Thermodesulfobacteriota bacterium]